MNITKKTRTFFMCGLLAFSTAPANSTPTPSSVNRKALDGVVAYAILDRGEGKGQCVMNTAGKPHLLPRSLRAAPEGQYPVAKDGPLPLCHKDEEDHLGLASWDFRLPGEPVQVAWVQLIPPAVVLLGGSCAIGSVFTFIENIGNAFDSIVARRFIRKSIIFDSLSKLYDNDTFGKRLMDLMANRQRLFADFFLPKEHFVSSKSSGEAATFGAIIGPPIGALGAGAFFADAAPLHRVLLGGAAAGLGAGVAAMTTGLACGKVTYLLTNEEEEEDLTLPSSE